MQDIKEFFNQAILFHHTFKVDSHVSKTNDKLISFNKRTGRRFLRNDDRILRHQDAMVLHLHRARINLCLDNKLQGYLWGLFIFRFTKSDFYTLKGSRRKIPDIDNLLKLPLDCLQKADVIENDTQFDQITGLKELTHGPTNELEIVIVRPPFWHGN